MTPAHDEGSVFKSRRMKYYGLAFCVKIQILGNLDFVTFIVCYDDQTDARKVN